MRLLLDTHVWLSTLASPTRLPAEALARLGDPDNELYLSAASTWEIAIKYALGKLPLPEPPARFVPPRLDRDGVIALPIEHAHTLAVAELPLHHDDPFDRLLIAQDQLEQMTLVTADPKMARNEVDLLAV